MPGKSFVISTTTPSGSAAPAKAGAGPATPLARSGIALSAPADPRSCWRRPTSIARKPMSSAGLHRSRSKGSGSPCVWHKWSMVIALLSNGGRISTAIRADVRKSPRHFVAGSRPGSNRCEGLWTAWFPAKTPIIDEPRQDQRVFNRHRAIYCAFGRSRGCCIHRPHLA